MKRAILLLVVPIILSVLFAVGISADVGNTNDYGADWGSDAGDLDIDWGDWETDIGYYGDDYYLSDSDIDDPVIIILIVAAIVIFIIVKAKTQNSSNNRSRSRPQTYSGKLPTVIDNTDVIESELRKIDPNFSAEKFIGWTKETFMTLQSAWTERNWSKIRPFEKEELFKQHELQLEEYKRMGRINVIERVDIREAYINRYVRDKDYEYLTVYLKARMGDYIIDEKTNELIMGARNSQVELAYLMGFMRKNGVKTDTVTSNHSTTNCPNCGAPTTVTSAGQCEYCDSVITTGEFDWVMYLYEGVKPGKAINNSPIDIQE